MRSALTMLSDVPSWTNIRASFGVRARFHVQSSFRGINELTLNNRASGCEARSRSLRIHAEIISKVNTRVGIHVAEQRVDTQVYFSELDC